MPEQIFVDASGWIALVNRKDAYHQLAKQSYQESLLSGKNLVTTTSVMLEVGNWLSQILLRKLATDLYDRIAKSARIETVQLTPDLYANGWELFRQRPDKEWGIVDCISFVVMQEQGIISALTADHHFEQAGFSILLK